MLRKDHGFPEALKRAMRLTGTSQAHLARECEVSRATVYTLLRGAEPADPNFAKLISLFPELSEFVR